MFLNALIHLDGRINSSNDKICTKEPESTSTQTNDTTSQNQIENINRCTYQAIDLCFLKVINTIAKHIKGW